MAEVEVWVKPGSSPGWLLGPWVGLSCGESYLVVLSCVASGCIVVGRIWLG